MTGSHGIKIFFLVKMEFKLNCRLMSNSTLERINWLIFLVTLKQDSSKKFLMMIVKSVNKYRKEIASILIKLVQSGKDWINPN